MADYVETSGIQGGTTRSDLTIVHTTAAGFADGVLAIPVYFGDTIADVASVTVNGSATGVELVVATENPMGTHDIWLYRFVGAQPATQYTVVITLDGSAEMWGEVIVVEDGDQTAPVRDFGTHTQDDLQSDDLTATVESDEGDLLLGFQTNNSSSTQWTAETGQTVIDFDSSSDGKQSAYQAGASPTATMTFGRPGPVQQGSLVVASFQSPQGSGGTTENLTGTSAGTSSDSATAPSLAVSITGQSAGGSTDSGTDAVAYAIFGTVLDGATPEQGAEVYLIDLADDSLYGMQETDESGVYRFDGVPAGSYHATVYVSGKTARSQNVTVG